MSKKLTTAQKIQVLEKELAKLRKQKEQEEQEAFIKDKMQHVGKLLQDGMGTPFYVCGYNPKDETYPFCCIDITLCSANKWYPNKLECVRYYNVSHYEPYKGEIPDDTLKAVKAFGEAMMARLTKAEH